jgi:hypothetical protein
VLQHHLQQHQQRACAPATTAHPHDLLYCAEENALAAAPPQPPPPRHDAAAAEAPAPVVVPPPAALSLHNNGVALEDILAMIR